MSKDFIGFRVTPDVKEQLKAEAEKEMRPLSHLVRDRVLRAAPPDAKIAVEPAKAIKEYEEVPQPQSFRQADGAALRAEAMELVRTKGLGFRAALDQVLGQAKRND